MKIFTVFLEHSNIFFKHTRNFYHEMFFDENLSKIFFIFPIFFGSFHVIFQEILLEKYTIFFPWIYGKIAQLSEKRKISISIFKTSKIFFSFCCLQISETQPSTLRVSIFNGMESSVLKWKWSLWKQICWIKASN